MKRSFAICIAFLSLCSSVLGAPTPPLEAILPGAQNIYLVKVTAIENGKVNFSIEEVLRGSTQELTNLISEPGYEFKPASEWVLISTRDLSNGNNIDDGFYGNFAWFPLTTSRVGKNITLGGFTEDGFKELLLKHPYKT